MSFDAAIQTLRERIPSLIAVYLYGSAARGQIRPDSDIDLALLADATLAPETLFDLSAEMAEILGRDVDLVDLARATPVLSMQVLDGKVLFCADRQKLAWFENLAMSRYCQLNADRREILKDIVSRGTVYAR